jgi:hypothetical protein
LCASNERTPPTGVSLTSQLVREADLLILENIATVASQNILSIVSSVLLEFI